MSDSPRYAYSVRFPDPFNDDAALSRIDPTLFKHIQIRRIDEFSKPSKKKGRPSKMPKGPSLPDQGAFIPQLKSVEPEGGFSGRRSSSRAPRIVDADHADKTPPKSTSSRRARLKEDAGTPEKSSSKDRSRRISSKKEQTPDWTTDKRKSRVKNEDRAGDAADVSVTKVELTEEEKEAARIRAEEDALIERYRPEIEKEMRKEERVRRQRAFLDQCDEQNWRFFDATDFTDEYLRDAFDLKKPRVLQPESLDPVQRREEIIEEVKRRRQNALEEKECVECKQRIGDVGEERFLNRDSHYCSVLCVRSVVTRAQRILGSSTAMVTVLINGSICGGPSLPDLADYLCDNPMATPVLPAIESESSGVKVKNDKSPLGKMKAEIVKEEKKSAKEKEFVRLKASYVRAITDALLNRVQKPAEYHTTRKEIKELGEEIVAAISKKYAQNFADPKCKQWVREFLKNINNKQNKGFFVRVVKKMITSAFLVDIQPENISAVEHAREVDAYTKTTSTPQHKIIIKSEPAAETAAGAEEALSKRDTTSEHGKHFFDVNCRKCRSSRAQVEQKERERQCSANGSDENPGITNRADAEALWKGLVVVLQLEVPMCMIPVNSSHHASRALTERLPSRLHCMERFTLDEVCIKIEQFSREHGPDAHLVYEVCVAGSTHSEHIYELMSVMIDERWALALPLPNVYQGAGYTSFLFTLAARDDGPDFQSTAWSIPQARTRPTMYLAVSSPENLPPDVILSTRTVTRPELAAAHVLSEEEAPEQSPSSRLLPINEFARRLQYADDPKAVLLLLKKYIDEVPEKSKKDLKAAQIACFARISELRKSTNVQEAQFVSPCKRISNIIAGACLQLPEEEEEEEEPFKQRPPLSPVPSCPASPPLEDQGLLHASPGDEFDYDDPGPSIPHCSENSLASSSSPLIRPQQSQCAHVEVKRESTARNFTDLLVKREQVQAGARNAPEGKKKRKRKTEGEKSDGEISSSGEEFTDEDEEVEDTAKTDSVLGPANQPSFVSSYFADDPLDKDIGFFTSDLKGPLEHTTAPFLCGISTGRFETQRPSSKMRFESVGSKKTQKRNEQRLKKLLRAQRQWGIVPSSMGSDESSRAPSPAPTSPSSSTNKMSEVKRQSRRARERRRRKRRADERAAEENWPFHSLPNEPTRLCPPPPALSAKRGPSTPPGSPEASRRRDTLTPTGPHSRPVARSSSGASFLPPAPMPPILPSSTAPRYSRHFESTAFENGRNWPTDGAVRPGPPTAHLYPRTERQRPRPLFPDGFPRIGHSIESGQGAPYAVRSPMEPNSQFGDSRAHHQFNPRPLRSRMSPPPSRGFLRGPPGGPPWGPPMGPPRGPPVAASRGGNPHPLMAARPYPNRPPAAQEPPRRGMPFASRGLPPSRGLPDRHFFF